jgi:hypothetical protein
MAGEIKPGSWYLCFKFHFCEQAIPLFEVSVDFQMQGDGTFVYDAVPCLTCGRTDRYPITEAAKLQCQPPPAEA